MAWYNISSPDGIAKEFDQKKRIEKCGSCGMCICDKKNY